MLLTLLQSVSGAVVIPPVVDPNAPFTGPRTNYTGRYRVTANRMAPYLHGSVWKKNYRDSV